MLRFNRIAAVTFIALAACQSTDITSGIGGLAFEATTAIVPPPTQNVQVTAKITNISSDPIDLHYGGCTVTPVFHTGSLDGPIAYDPRPTQSCTANAITKSLDPDQSVQIVGSAAPNLPAGKYFVEAVIAVNGETVSIGAGTVTF